MDIRQGELGFRRVHEYNLQEREEKKKKKRKTKTLICEYMATNLHLFYSDIFAVYQVCMR